MTKSPERSLVTGGAGFLGSSIVRELLERGGEVRVLALPSETLSNLDGLDVEVVRGNVLSTDDCAAAVEGVHAVFHAAAVFKDYMADPTLMYDVNSRGSFHVIEAARRAGVERVVYTASIVALGRSGEGPPGNEETPYNGWETDFHYSRSKYHSLAVARCFAEWGYDVRVVCPGVIFGPRDIAPTPSGKLIINSLKGAPPIYSDGGASYVDVRDVARAHVLAATKGEAGEIYVASAHNLDNLAFVQAIERAAGLKPRRYLKVPRAVARAAVTGSARAFLAMGREPLMTPPFLEYSFVASYFDNSKSVQELGATYRPIEESIRDAIEWFRANGKLR